jgi:hypothetical protein
MRRLTTVLGAMLLAAACGTPTYAEGEIADALAQLRPSDPGVTWGEFLTTCALEAGFSGELAVEAQGGVEYETQTPRDEEIMDECTAASEDVFVFPDIEDDRLQHAAMYELHERAAACVREELGLDPQLPSLERYVDSGGDWNVYDTSEPADESEWVRWNETCPQDLWHYYEPQA